VVTKRKPEPTITIDELMAEMERHLLGGDVEGVTIEDVVRGRGCCKTTAYAYVRRMVKAGKWSLLGYRRTAGTNGRISKTGVYGHPREG